MKEKLATFKNYIYKNRISVLLILIVFITTLTIGLCTSSYLDDSFFYNIIEERGGYNLPNVFSYLGERYYTWSSRLGIEFWLVTFVRVPILFRILNAAMASFCFAFALIVLKNTHICIKLLVCVAALAINPSCFNDAGYIATNMNYLWPVTFAVYSAYVSFSTILNRKINKIHYFLSPVFLVIVSFWLEAVAIPFILLYAFCIIYNRVVNKKWSPYLIVCVGLAIGFTIFELTCPGNAVRVEKQEPDFIYLTFAQKLNRSIFYSYWGLCSHKNAPSYLFFCIIPIFALINKKSLFVRINSFLPITFFVVYCVVSNIFINDNFHAIYIFNKGGISGISVFLMCICYVSIIASILLMYKDMRKNSILLITFVVGVGSSAMLGFTSSIEANRPFLLMYYSMIFISIYYLKDLNEILLNNSQKKHIKHRKE